MKSQYRVATDPYIAIWVVIVVAVGAAGSRFSHFIMEAFRTNTALNTIIWTVSGFGAVLVVRHLWMVTREKRLLYAVAAGYQEQTQQARQDNGLVADLFRRLDSFGMFSQEVHTPESVVEHELDHLKGTLSHRLEPAEFIAGSMVGLGLLGTFIGLLETLVKTSEVIATIASSISESANLTEQFRKMVTELQGPLSGMGTAFSASLFGLLTSMVLGLMILVVRGSSQDLMRRTRALLAQYGGVTAAAGQPGQATDENLRLMLAELMAETRRNAAAISRLTDESRRSAESAVLFGHGMENYAARLDTYGAALARLNGNFSRFERLPQLVEQLVGEAASMQSVGRQQEAALKEAILSLYRIAQGVERQGDRLERAEAGVGSLLQLLDAGLATPVIAGLRQMDARLAGLSVLLERRLEQAAAMLDGIAGLQREAQLNGDALKSALARVDVQMLERGSELIAAIESMGAEIKGWSARMAQAMEGFARHDERLRDQMNLAERQIEMDKTQGDTLSLLSESLIEGCTRLANVGKQLQLSLEEYRGVMPEVNETLHGMSRSIARLQVGIADLRRAAEAEQAAE